MSQTWTDDVYASGHVGQTDLQNMENNFACLKSAFSGTTSPASPVDGTIWKDTTKKLLKIYNGSSWIGIMHGDTSQKLWVYRNAAMDGWAIDATPSDKVLAFKGGSTYTTGGAVAGSWIFSGVTAQSHTHTGVSHNHNWYNSSSDPNSNDQTYNSSGVGINFVKYGKNTSGWTAMAAYLSSDANWPGYAPGDSYTSNAGSGATGASGSLSVSGSTWRPAASVGTLQYLDI